MTNESDGICWPCGVWLGRVSYGKRSDVMEGVDKIAIRALQRSRMLFNAFYAENCESYVKMHDEYYRGKADAFSLASEHMKELSQLFEDIEHVDTGASS
jgi:uncharacterized protein (UPF0264 family)